MIYIKDVDLTQIKDIKELLLFGFSNEDGKFKQTYINSECTTRECHSARRSFLDLLTICQTYFPPTSETVLAKALFELSKTTGISCRFCTDINKIVFRNYPDFMYGNKRRGIIYQYFNDTKVGVDGISLKYIISLTEG